MEEKTAKIKVVNINDRYITKTIQFKIDAIKSTILEVNYIIVATNDTFSSPPIKIDLERQDICSFLLYHLYKMQKYIECIDSEVFTGEYIQCEGIIPDVNTIIFEDEFKTDDMGRSLIEFSYVMKEINTIDIPIEIMPVFLDTFIQILKDKDIIIEEESDESEGESDGDKGDGENNEPSGEEKTDGTEHNSIDN